MTNSTLVGFKQVRWRSHRGMLELDMILLPFVDNHYQHLTPEQQQQYMHLLEAPDPDLFNYFLRHEKSDDPIIQNMVELILAKHQQDLA